MSPTLALLVYAVFLVALLRYDPNRATASPALWIPLTWMFIVGSRLPSQWLGLTAASTEAAFEEGSPLDRVVYLVLIAMALWILASRRLHWDAVVSRNLALAAFLLFGLTSVVWSDFPFVTFKRWIRDLGMYLMVLIVLSDPHPLTAISLLVRRLSCLLLVPSVLLIKYYPETGVLYDSYTGRPEYAGAALTKNTLGGICLITGLFAFWDILGLWPERRKREVRRVLLIDAALLAMTLWLLNLTDSATSRVCLLIGCLIMMIVRSKWTKANPWRVLIAIPVALFAYLFLEFAFDLSGTVAYALGRDPTLTGRTGIWNALLGLKTNPLVGVGYQSFWLGERLTSVMATLKTGFLNEAHNGYLEMYLNLGLIGLALLGLFLVSSYSTLSRQLISSAHFASLGLAFWVAMVFYNASESAYGASLLWCILLLCVVRVPTKPAESRTQKSGSVARARAVRTGPSPPGSP